jgi:aminoglycoside phosphotransferase (APT) family kinase protein
MGESYAAWLVDTANPVVVRIPYREAAAMPRPIAAEFAALKLVPPEVGTHGLAVGLDENNPLGCRFVMTTYAPGETKPVEAWTSQDVALVVDQLKVLHRYDQPKRGLVNHPQPGPLDIGAEFEAGWTWWQANRPQITQLSQVQKLLPAARRFLAARAPEFSALDQFSLTHSDLIANNVVFHRGRARFIDWEWAEYGDPARDLALLGGTIHGGPWYIPLDAVQVQNMVDAYVKGVESTTGRILSAQEILRRRDAWEVCERFQGGMHYLFKTAQLPESHYVEGAVQVWSTLEARLATG